MTAKSLRQLMKIFDQFEDELGPLDTWSIDALNLLNNRLQLLKDEIDEEFFRRSE